MKKTMTMRKSLSLTGRCLRDIHRICPGRICSVLLVAMLQGLTPYVTIWFSAQLINELSGLRRPELLTQWVLLTLGVTVLLALLTEAAYRWENFTNTVSFPGKDCIFAEKFFHMDYADLDNQKVRDQYAQIRQNETWQGWGFNQAIACLQYILKAVFGILGAVALTVSLFIQRVPEGSHQWLNSPLIALVLLGWMCFIIWFGASRQNVVTRKTVALSEKAKMGNRFFTALDSMTSDPQRRLDIRTYNQQNMTDAFLSDHTFGPGGAFDRLARSFTGIMGNIGTASSALLTGAVYVFTCLKAWAGAFGIGSVTQYVGAVTALSANISMLLEKLEVLRSNGEFLETIYDFLDIPNKMYQGSLTTEKRSDREYQVEFRDVSFKYPGSDNWALHHVNMKFQIGRRLAIVGENGSGKTTFIKLLCRLYDPQEGQILLNGIDIRKYRYDDYMEIFSVVFQDFKLLSQPLGDNVAGSSTYDCIRAEKALVDAGFGDRLKTMPQGLDTMLYKDFAENGVEVSGGEAQKIAIARALYKDAPFIILDEPTAGLDPIAEAEIYEKFNEISGDRTAIYISHRLSSCKFCDEIAVFDHGQVIQQGTHEALLADVDGKYAALWNAQAQYYVENHIRT